MEDPVESFKPDRLKHSLTGHKRAVSAVEFSHNGRFIASYSADKTVRTYSLSSPKALHNEFHGHDLGISDLAFSGDGCFLATAFDDRTVRLWDAASGSLLDSSPRVVMTGFAGFGILLLGMKTLIDDEHPPVNFVKFSPNGKFLLVGTLDNTLVKIFFVPSLAKAPILIFILCLAM